jgi:pyruvate,water dikinase
MITSYVHGLNGGRPRSTIGQKAADLSFLLKEGMRIPKTFVCSWDAYLHHLSGRPRLLADLRAELSRKLDLSLSYAVRSSANLEGSLGRSFAGQFESVLDVRGLDDLMEALRSVWASAQAPDVHTYLHQNGLHPRDLRMAVIIQEMVDPVISGVSFSKNPVTGLDEVVVEAVEGSGQALVQRGVTPTRWINKWDNWIIKPRQGGSDLGVIEEVVRQTRSIADTYGQPVDLEFVYDGHVIHWVQLRAITALDVDVYSNRIAREVFPGMIKPLVWSINVPLVNGAWVRLFTELIGPNDIDPEHLAKSFHYRAYFNMGTIGQIFEHLGFPRESLELLMGLDIDGADRPSFKPTPRTYRLLPRMLRFAARMLGFGRRIEAFLPTMEARYRALPTERIEQLTEEQLIESIDRLYALTQQSAYYNIVTPLLMQAYNHLLKNRLARLGVDFESLDLTGDMEELEQFAPNAHLAALNRQVSALDAATRGQIDAGGYDAVLRLPETHPLRRGMAEFIGRFGHLSDSGNDFSSVPWREEPDLVLHMIVNYTPPEDGSGNSMRLEDLDIPWLQRPLTRWIYRRARRFTAYREAVGSLYTFGYGLFRIHLLALGDRFLKRDILASKEDIFYLSFEEVRSIVAGDGEAHCQGRIAERKEDMEACRHVTLPTVIYGDDVPPLAYQTDNTLQGTPTSRGQYTGPVTVVQGIRDFDRVANGDVLVIPYSDVGWTPLFARAGAVVAESGGLLSHSSIVAREYGIPATVSVPGACQLKDNTIVTVDGYRGDVIIHERPTRPPRTAKHMVRSRAAIDVLAES